MMSEKKLKTHPAHGIISLMYLCFMICFLIHMVAWARLGMQWNADLLSAVLAYAGMRVMVILQNATPNKYRC